MGMVTFDGDGVATRESQAWFRQEELKILQGPGDENQKARQIEMLYASNRLEYGTFQQVDNASYSNSPEPQGSAFGWLLGMICVGLVVVAMKIFGS